MWVILQVKEFFVDAGIEGQSTSLNATLHIARVNSDYRHEATHLGPVAGGAE